MRLRQAFGSMVLLAAVAGCGSGGATGTPTPTGQDELVIVARTAATAPAVTWQLRCDPPGGSHPDPATACRVLTEHGDQALPAVPGATACTQIYGGPEQATVTGTWHGRPIQSSFARDNGCQIARWTALTGLLPAPTR